MSNLSIQPTNVQQNKKMSPVKKGALIAGGLKVAIETISTGILLKKWGKDTFVKEAKNAFGSMGKCAKCASLFALGLALWTAVGAGIGKIVEVSKNKKAQNQAEG